MTDPGAGARLSQTVMMLKQMREQKEAQRALGQGMLRGIGTQPGGPENQYFAQPPQMQQPGQPSQPMQQGGPSPGQLQQGGQPPMPPSNVDRAGVGQLGPGMSMDPRQQGFDPRQQFDMRTKQGVHNMMRYYAKTQGWDPAEAERDYLKMIDKEMGPGGIPGDIGRDKVATSFSPAQYHMGGLSSDPRFSRPGLGDVYKQETGKDVRESKNWPDAIEWGMRKAHSDPSILNQWNGWKRSAGIKGPDMSTPGGQAVADQASRKMLDWTVMARAIRDANPNIKPETLADAVTMSMPMMNQASNAEWRGIQAELREQSARTAEGRLDETIRENHEKDYARDRRINIADQNLELAKQRLSDTEKQREFWRAHIAAGDTSKEAKANLEYWDKAQRRDWQAYNAAMNRKANALNAGPEDEADAQAAKKRLKEDEAHLGDLAPSGEAGKGGAAPDAAQKPPLFMRRGGGGGGGPQAISPSNKALEVQPDEKTKAVIEEAKKYGFTDEEIKAILAKPR